METLKMKNEPLPSTPGPEETPPRLALVGEPDNRGDAADANERSLTPLEERQRLLSQHVKLVARGLTNGLFVYGAAGGLGKSRVIQETLAAEGASVVLLNSHITALSLYETLFLNQKGKVIWLDDCDALYGDLKILGLLRSALWGQGGERVVTYTSSQLGELPNSFTFESRVIMTANSVPKRNDAFRAVLSRIDVFELSATNEEVLDLMRSLASNGFEGLTPEECLSVVEFIEQNGAGRQLSLRLLEPSYKKVLFARAEGLSWEALVRTQLQTLGRNAAATAAVGTKAHELQVLQQSIERYPESVRDQQVFWSKVTGKSRASFFRVLTRRRQEGASDPPRAE